ncbi:hemoglobin subunit beta-1-like [Oncorhynchus keta]|uniref:hemoglobin subunit beta-1-like n=1 Tax=Oncorhynchus keta TaxID=8018 RepID=UPI0015FA0FB0|nr:hemoglobin subunit beta-1-like [Oncorhynchus keta]
MVDWIVEKRKLIIETWGKIKVKVVRPLALRWCLIVYPWTQRYFGTFGDLNSAAAIMGNKTVAKRGITVLNGIKRAVYIHQEHLRQAERSAKLHVDPDNFRLLGDCLTVVLASQMSRGFTPDVQAAWQKFLTVVISALGRQYN